MGNFQWWSFDRPDQQEIWPTAGAAGDYTLTVTMVTNGKTCTISETTTVVNDANVPPAPTFLAGPLMVCEGDTATYTIANIPSVTGYTWTVPPPATFSGSGTSIQVAWNGSGNTQVCVTADNDCGSSPQTCLNITVNQIPTADFTFDSPICVTDSSTITYTGNANPNANYQWSFNGGTPSMVTGPGPHEIRWATTGTKNVTLVVEENGCVSEMNTQQVIVQGPLPAPVINCSPTINSVTFNWNAVPGADSYDVIINGGAPVNQTNTSFSVTGLAPNDIVTITVIAIGTTACGPSMSSSDCQAQNCPQITLDIDPVMDICRDANTTPINLGYQIAGDDGSGTFTWGGPGVDANGVFDPNAANLGSNTITLNYQEGNCSYNASITIVVNEAPTNDFTVESPICETDVSNIVYTGNASSNATFTWDFDGGTITNGASNEGPYEIMWSSTGTKNISLIVEENGCALPANQQTVQVDVQLTPPVISCQSTTNTVDLTWTTDPNATNVTVNVLSGSTGTQNGNNYNVSGLVPGDSTVLEVVTTANSVCGPVADTLTCIAASCPPVMLNIEPIGPFCDDGNGTPVPLNAVVSGGTGLGTFTWTGPGVNANNEFDPNAPAVIAGSVNRIRVTYLEDNCTFNASFDVVVNPQPSSTFQVTGPICITDVSTLEYLGNPNPNATYTWNLDGGTPASITGPGPHDISWGTSGSKSISLIVEANNCPSEETVIPVRVDTLLAPPVISCNSTTSTVDFTWNNVPGATSYTVNLLNGSGGTYNGGFGYNVNGITVGDSSTIEVVANGPTVCGPSSSTLTCYAAPCPPIELTLDPIPDMCLYPNTLATNLNDFLTITGSVTGNPSVTWDGGGYVTLGGSFFPLQASTGTHPIRAIVEESGCTFEVTGEIVVNAIPLADMIVEPIICIDDTSSVFFNGLAGTNASYFWDFGNGFDTWLQGGDAGPFALQWNDPGLDSISLYIIENGCISDTVQRNIEIVDYLTPPVINCEGGATDVTFSWDTIPGATDYTVAVDNSPSGANFVPGINSYTVNTILPLDSVTITLTVGDSTSPCGPVTTTQTCIADDCPSVLLAFNPEPPICLDANAQNADVSDNVVITGNLSTNGTIAWTGPGTSPDGTFNPFDAGIGVHTLTVTYEEFNCTYNGTIDITVNDLPIADAGQDQTLTCNATSVDLGGSGNNQNPSTVSYSWSGNVTQPSSVFTSTTENGTFTLTATDQATGCVNTDEVEVIIDNEPPDLDAAVENISCFGRNDGTININGVSGGTPPYMFAYNGGALTSQQYFNNLGPGSHEIVVEDSNGCMDTVTFTINEPDELNVEIVIVTGENPVPLGDSIQISAVTNFAPELLTNVSWTPIDQFPLCNEVNLTNCLTAWVTPTGQTVYTVRIEAGPCAAEDNFQLNVKKIRPVYIPSAFSPNLEDGLNDGFQIFADPEVAVNVKSFLIFDRWGEVVFEAYDFEPSLMENPDNAWNGEFRGKKLNSGVFVYFAEIEFFDGITEIFKGDVTIR
ncbi:MAG: gliding motility-associated C-terminal domain-containing protein [Saprospiraceae bacterium]